MGAGGVLSVDVAQVALGRGGYVCGEGCLKAADRRKAWARAFKGKAVAPPKGA